MIQKDDQNYTFVFSFANRNSIKIRRYAVSRRAVRSGFCVIAVSLGVLSAGFLGLGNANFSDLTAKINVRDFAAAIKNQPKQLGEGGPETEERIAIPAYNPEVENRFKELEAKLRDRESIPSIYPLIGKINNEYGWRRNPFGAASYERHSGMDIDGEKGAPVIAPGNGVVIKAGWQGGYGNLIELDHGNGVTTRYGHLSTIEVEVGQEIKRNQEIGKVGSTGRSTGPHLHYEVRLNNEAVNPRAYLPQNSDEQIAEK